MGSPSRFAPEADDLESVIATAELSRRAPRRSDHEAENRILVSLAQNMVRSPGAILQSLAQTALISCGAGSAGISLIERGAGIFRWHALVGELEGHLGEAIPRDFSPCGTVVDRNSTLLFSHLERHFKYFAEMKPAIVEALLVPFSLDGEPVGTIWVMTHDEQRHLDGEDARLIGNLGKFTAAAHQLRCALAAAEEGSRLKDEYLAILSHELRNPLAALQIVADLVASGRSADEISRAGGVIQRQVMHLDRLIRDAYDVARIHRGKLELRKERTALMSIVEDAIEISLPAIDSADQSITVAPPSDPAFVEADRVRLTQVLSNLLSNASKFTPRGGRLQLRAEVQGAHASIRVRDDGIGIAPGMLGSIFDMGVQLVPEGRSAPAGMGIGLALARSLVEVHGGTLEAHSAGPGKGSEFVVRLPLASPPQPSVVISPRPPDASSPLRVLVVDDHRDTADALTWVLQSIGHHARAAYDGPSALHAVEQHAPDVIIQDLGMPHMSGYEIARQLRLLGAAKDAMLVAVSGYPQPEAQMEDAAFDQFLAKPVGLTELQEMLSSASARLARKSGEPAQ